MPLEALRTDDSRFEGLPGWPYQPRYIDDLPGYQGLRMHYVDDGQSDAETYLCLHGEPTWGYLYRRMIPVFRETGARVVVPDFYGFGRSDKPVDETDYTWDFHRAALLGLIECLDLERITLVVQDWGGLLGLTLPVDLPERVVGLLIMNTTFGAGAEPTPGFVDWRDYVAANPDLAVDRLIARACPHLSPDESAAYAAPFPGPKHKAGVRAFPRLVPTDRSMDGVEVSRRAMKWWSTEFEGRSFMAIGATDPVLGSVMPTVHRLIKGCPPPLVLPHAGHFVPEWGEEVASAALAEWGR